MFPFINVFPPLLPTSTEFCYLEVALTFLLKKGPLKLQKGGPLGTHWPISTINHANYAMHKHNTKCRFIVPVIVLPGILVVSVGTSFLHKLDWVLVSCWERSLALHCIQDSKKQNQTLAETCW